MLFDNDMEEATQIYDKVEGVFNYNDVYKKEHGVLTNKTSTLYLFAAAVKAGYNGNTKVVAIADWNN